jgi:hypothetical protein
MPHELLQCRNPHVFIRFMRAERVPQGVDADLLPNAGLLHIFRHEILDRGDVEGRPIFREKKDVVIYNQFGLAVSQVISKGLGRLIH